MTKEEKRSILIVEDEDALRDVLSKKFTNCGFTVHTAADGKEGLAVALKHKPSLLIIDLVMPVMDGIALLQELRKDDWGKHVSVIVLSNTDDITSISSVMSCGVFDFLLKSSCSLDQLEERVYERLRQAESGIIRPTR